MKLIKVHYPQYCEFIKLTFDVLISLSELMKVSNLK